MVRDLMFKGKRTYTEFLASEERISTNILADRLRRLDEQGVVRTEGRGRSRRYSLTEKGLDLLPLMVEMILWGARHDEKTAAPRIFTERARADRSSLLAELEGEIREAHGL